MNRRFRKALTLAVATVSAATVVSACSSSSGNGNKASGGLQNVQVMMFPGQAYRLEVLVADQKGFFKDHGIKVNVIAQPSTLQGAQALLSTKSDVGQLSTSTLAQGVEAGSPVAFFCGGINVLQTTLVAKNGSSLPSTADGSSWQKVLTSLSGKKVGVQTPVGSGLQLLFAEALKEAGVSNVTYVNLGGGNDITLAGLGHGSVDVAQSNPPGTQAFAAQKQVKALLYMPDGPEIYKDYGSAWSAPTSWLKSNPKAAKGFCDAAKEALNWIKDPANAKEAAQILAKDTAVDPKIAQLVVQQAYKDFSTDLPQSVLMKTLSDYKQIGITKTDLSSKYDQLVQVPSSGG